MAQKTRRLLSVALTVVMAAGLVVFLVGCGGQSASSASTGKSTKSNAAKESVQPESKSVLGIVVDEGSGNYSESDATELCKSLGLDMGDYDEWHVATATASTAKKAAEQLVSDYDCTDIVFAAQGSADAAEEVRRSYSDVEVYVADSAKVVKPVVEAQYSIEEALTEFSGDRAWVSYRDDKDLYYGLIDNNGYIVWSVKQSDLQGWGFTTGMTESDGTCCLFSDNDPGVAYVYNPGMIILDHNGNVIFDSRNADEGTTFYYLGYGDGTFLTIKHVEGFSENRNSLCEMDANGNIVHEIDLPEYYEGKIHYEQNFTYMGDDVYAGSWTGSVGELWMYDRKNHRFYRSDDKYAKTLRIVEIVSSEETVFEEVQGNMYYSEFDKTDNYYLLDTSSLHDSSSFEKGQLDGKGYKLTGAVYGERLFNCAGASYSDVVPGVYDYKGNLLAAYPADWNITGVSAFQNGYATVDLKGADNKDYITVVDTNATPQFDPVKSDSEDAKRLVEQYMKSESKGYSRSYNDKSKKHDAYTDENGNTLKTIYAISNFDEVAKQ